MDSTGLLKTITINSVDYRLIKKVVQDDNVELLIIPLKRDKSSDSSNIVCNWMDDIIEIIEKGEKNFGKPDMIMSEIKAYCKSVKTTVTSK